VRASKPKRPRPGIAEHPGSPRVLCGRDEKAFGSPGTRSGRRGCPQPIYAADHWRQRRKGSFRHQQKPQDATLLLDTLIIETALSGGANRLLTEDLQHGRP